MAKRLRQLGQSLKKENEGLKKDYEIEDSAKADMRRRSDRVDRIIEQIEGEVTGLQEGA